MIFLPQEVIRDKRDGMELTPKQINPFIEGLIDGTVSEAQVAAFAMAVFFNGMTTKEIHALTHAMKSSGDVLEWRDMDGPVVDKHSTGGVGDKVSLLLAPICAACGCYVPMISGRGLGHTGGTLDKLNAIPGYNVAPDIPTFVKNVKKIGCAIIGQTSSMAPADRVFYRVRDVTATVESIPLITASILSKKLCAGLDVLTMDIKVGNGAFMTHVKSARELGDTIKTTAEKHGVKTGIVITDMNEVLGRTVGNATEVLETVEFLKNNVQETRLKKVTYALCENILLLSNLYPSGADARIKIRSVVESGGALEKFSKMIAAGGGPVDFCDTPTSYLREAPVVSAIPAPASGYVCRQDARRIGLSVTAMGGGRIQTTDIIDSSVGFSRIKSLGMFVSKGEPLAFVHTTSKSDAEHITREYLAAIQLSETRPNPISPVVVAD